MNHTKKPRSMNPSTFITRCTTLFRYVPYLSMEDGTAPIPFSGIQQKKLIIKMLPEMWQQCMEDAGISTVNMELTRMLEFMNNQCKLETIRQEPLKRNNTSNDDT